MSGRWSAFYYEVYFFLTPVNSASFVSIGCLNEEDNRPSPMEVLPLGGIHDIDRNGPRSYVCSPGSWVIKYPLILYSRSSALILACTLSI